jgi:hypothetical protein
MGVSNAAWSTPSGEPLSPPAGSPLWLLSDVGPATILPGTTVDLAVFAPRAPGADPAPPAVDAAGTLSITFVDCHAATAAFDTPTLVTVTSIGLLAGVGDAPEC